MLNKFCHRQTSGVVVRRGRFIVGDPHAPLEEATIALRWNLHDTLLVTVLCRAQIGVCSRTPAVSQLVLYG